jgi:hypothetical protein
MSENPQAIPTDPEVLHSRIHESWEALAAVVSELDEPHVVRRDPGEWSVKDVLAHIAAWEKFVITNQFLGLPPAEALGMEPEVIARHDEDEMNAILFERNRDRPLAEVQSDWFETHRWLMSEIARLTQEQLAAPTRCIGPEARPLAEWIVFNTYDHYEDHRRAIENRRTG